MHTGGGVAYISPETRFQRRLLAQPDQTFVFASPNTNLVVKISCYPVVAHLKKRSSGQKRLPQKAKQKVRPLRCDESNVTKSNPRDVKSAGNIVIFLNHEKLDCREIPYGSVDVGTMLQQPVLRKPDSTPLCYETPYIRFLVFKSVQSIYTLPSLSHPTRSKYIVDSTLSSPGSPCLAQVIRKMAENIQPPDPERFKWERHTSVIEPSGFRQNVGGVREGDHDADVLEHRRESSPSSGAGTESGDCVAAMLSFWRVIAAAAEDPVPPLPVPATILREQARAGEYFGYILYIMGLRFFGITFFQDMFLRVRCWFSRGAREPQKGRECTFCVGSANGGFAHGPGLLVEVFLAYLSVRSCLPLVNECDRNTRSRCTRGLPIFRTAVAVLNVSPQNTKQ